jgi:hypothetical protein
MKRLVWFAASLLMISTTSLALAQDATPAAGTPAPSENHGWKNASPAMKEIHDRIKLQQDRIAAGVQKGTLTADQASALKEKLKAIHEEIKADFEQNKQNGQKGLTDDQKTQIKSELDANSAAIKDEKQDSSAPASTPANP